MFAAVLMIALLETSAQYSHTLCLCVYCLSIEIDYIHININNGNGSNGVEQFDCVALLCH